MNSKRRRHRESFSFSLLPVLILGTGLACCFFALIITGPLDFALLRRYCLSHPVAIASVCLFFVGIVTLAMKWYQALTQLSLTGKASAALRRLVTDGEEVVPNQRAQWLQANWSAQPAATNRSWLGDRLTRTIDLQISRGRRHQLEADLKAVAEADADRQHDSYSLLRIINWAMPMLGFLGTVLGISQTLGQLDTKMLATQQQEAMNQLTAGLYVAFDTTAIALILTVFLMFVQFAVSRLELSLLATIDRDSNQALIEFLAVDPFDAQDSLLTPVRQMATELITSVKQLVEEQSKLWSESIAESQRQWTAWTQNASERIESDLAEKIGCALDSHVAALGELQDEGYRLVDARWQQWQTTLSDQARLVQTQQKEIIHQSDKLGELLDSTVDLRKLEEVIGDSVSRLENLGRLEEATVCVGEAVAVLATSLERAGLIRGAPIRPRIHTPRVHTEDEDVSHGESADNSSSSTPPPSRKAA